MKTTVIVKHLIAGMACAFITLSGHAQNVLIDPGFENQTPAATGGWFTFGGVFTTAYARTGHSSMFVGVFEGVTGAFEQAPAAPGSKWQLTGYGMTPVQL